MVDLRRKVPREAPDRRMVEECRGLDACAQMVPEPGHEVDGSDGVEPCAHERCIASERSSHQIRHGLLDDVLKVCLCRDVDWSQRAPGSGRMAVRRA